MSGGINGINSINGLEGNKPVNGKKAQVKDSINILNPENKIIEEKEILPKDSENKTDSAGEKLSMKDRWQNFKGKMYRLFHGTKGMQRDPDAPKPWE